MSELNPCPFGCISDIGPRAIDGDVFYQCSACMCRGPAAHKSFERAAALWNSRSPSLSEKPEKQIDAAMKALQFYADPANYCMLFMQHLPKDDPRTFAPVLQDDGKQARAVLEAMAEELRSLAHREKAQTIHEWLADTAEGK